jgi:ribosome-associated protein
MQTFHLRGDFITLGQLLKVVGLVETGGQAKVFLTEETVLVNGEVENRRGRKLFAGDRVEIEDVEPMVMAPDPYAEDAADAGATRAKNEEAEDKEDANG